MFLDAPNAERMRAEKALKCSRCGVRHSVQIEGISGSQEVTGSTPVFSTIKPPYMVVFYYIPPIYCGYLTYVRMLKIEPSNIHLTC